MQRWYFLTGDSNWRQYGGKWYTKVEKGCYKVLELINYEEATGEKYSSKADKFTYVAEVKEIYFEWYSEKDIDHAIGCCGIESNCISPLTQLEAMHDYGYGDHVWTGWGNNIYKLLLEAKSH